MTYAKQNVSHNEGNRVDRLTGHVMAMLDRREQHAACGYCRGYGIRVVGGVAMECGCQGMDGAECS